MSTAKQSQKLNERDDKRPEQQDKGGHQREESLTPQKPERDWRMLLRLWQVIRPYRGIFLACLLLLPVASGLSLLQPYLIQLAIDEHFVPGKLEGLGLVLGGFGLTLLAEYMVRFGQFYLMELAGQKALRDLRCNVFDHMQRLKLSYFHRNPVGRLMTRLTSDVDSLQQALSSGVVTIIGDLVTLAAIITILLVKNWRLALVTFAVVPLLFLISFTFRHFMRQAYRVLRVKIARLNAHLQESVTGMDVVQLFAHEEASRSEYDEVNADHRDAAYRSIRYDAILYALVEMISSVAIACIIWYGAGEAAADLISLGALVAFIEYVQKFFVPIRDLSQTSGLIQSALASSERLFEVLDTDEFLSEEHNAKPIETFARQIEFRNVWFAYEGDNWILKDVSFTIEQGQKVAFVGHTGAGKSTMIGLLTRLYDIQRGQILIDGVDIRHLQLGALRELYALVLQDGFLFTGTIGDNITMSSPRIDQDGMRQAAALVGVDKLIERYDDGYEHRVLERGSNLSVGERQLVTFARALAHQPQILILDEATANVDTETEAMIQRAVAAMLQQQTSVVIAHRLSTIQNVDQIIVLKDGRIAEKGSHDQLLAQGGLYHRFVELQGMA